MSSSTDSYSEIGSLLRRAREEKGLGVERAAHMMHIRARYLTALEQGDLSELPGPTYAKGYLQSYASFLELDKKEIIRRFEQVEGLAKRGFYFPQALGREKNPSGLAVWGGLAAAIAAYIAWHAVWQARRVPVSVVEPFPKKVAEPVAPAPIPIAKDDACSAPQIILYPPCTMARGQGLDMVPLPGPMNSVMDVAELNDKR